MLPLFVTVYLAVTIAIGLFAARRVRDRRDYLVAGRRLPLVMNVATVFATWFGAETVLAVSATFATDGLAGLAGDPFGASACLVLAALLFARMFYRLDLLTIGDFYRRRFGRGVEVAASAAIALSYLGWTSAQMMALGLVIHVLSGAALALGPAIAIGAGVVLLYTVFGGMWSVAFTDLFQTLCIVVGLGAVAILVGEQAGGFDAVMAQAVADGRLVMFPEDLDAVGAWAMAGAFLAFAFGSIPQQDVFQRITSARDERTAVRGTLLGGLLYFAFAFVPAFIVHAALMTWPEAGELLSAGDAQQAQRVLPELVLARMPMWAQVLFFGALLSAILSTASGALLAPTALIAENVVKPLMPRLRERHALPLLRGVLVLFSGAALVFALRSDDGIHAMVQNAYNVTLVGAFVPLLAGAFWPRANARGALWSMVLGIAAWLAATAWAADAMVPPNLIGLAAAGLGMVGGTLLRDPRPAPRPVAAGARVRQQRRST